MNPSIPVRRPQLDFSDVPRYWFDGSPFGTHFLNALSSTFPDGEAFFVRSVLHYKAEIDDPELLAAIRGFSGQEGQHSHQHDLHVKMLVAQGYPGIALRNRLMRWVMQKANRYVPAAALRSTASLEHLTAILARRLLRDRGFSDRMDPRMAELWRWHALEEAEHKAVAFDVMKLTADNHPMRLFSLTMNTVGLFFEALDRTAYMLWKDGLLFRRETWQDGWRFLFGPDGFLRGMGPDFLSWYRRDFHPNQVDDRPLLQAERVGIEAAIAR